MLNKLICLVFGHNPTITWQNLLLFAKSDNKYQQAINWTCKRCDRPVKYKA